MVFPLPPPPPPLPPPPSLTLPLKDIIFKRRRNNLLRIPPPIPSFGPVLPLGLVFKRRRNTLSHQNMLTWYLLTLMMRQKLQTRIKKSEEWMISIKGKMEQTVRDNAKTCWSKLCIYRVPHYLQENNKKSYFPQTVSLGPYHHGKEHLLPMEHHKWRALNMVVKRTNHRIEMYMNAMKKLEKRARACYEGPIGLSSNEFVEMLVLDGVFVLELIRGTQEKEGFWALEYDRDDPIFAIRGSTHSIQRDMIMLENQLPLFVLNQLLDLQLGTKTPTGLVAELAIKFFDPLMPTTKNSSGGPTSVELSDEDDLSDMHCLDVFRQCLLKPRKGKELSKSWEWCSRVADKRKQKLIPCVTELRDSGFQFRIGNTDRFWDIRFNKSYLEIPKLLIHEGTKSLFLNLIAFEQCHIDLSNDITAYIIFMNSLIDSEEDISYLHQCGIIEHSLGSNSEVVDMFNRLCQDVVFNTNEMYLSKLLDDVQQCHKQRYMLTWNTWKTTLKQKYFHNPWAYLSFFAAVFLLILTFFQTYFAAYAYFIPPS